MSPVFRSFVLAPIITHLRSKAELCYFIIDIQFINYFALPSAMQETR
jgi:hypothetical protein